MPQSLACSDRALAQSPPASSDAPGDPTLPAYALLASITRTGYLHRAHAFTVGENIGGGRGRRHGSPMAVFDDWMHSPAHRANILDPAYRDVGVGIARGYPIGADSGSATYTVDFGSRGDG